MNPLVKASTSLLTILLLSTEILMAQTSRLRFEPIAFRAYGSSRFNPSTFATTPDDFLRVTSFGATYNKYGKYQAAFSRSSNPQFQFGLLFYYELTPLSDVQFGLLTSLVGGVGEWNAGAGTWARGVNLPLMISYKLKQFPKLKGHIDIMGGASLTFTTEGWAPFYITGSSTPGNIFSYYHDSKIVNKFGTCLYGGIQWKQKIYNGNSINFKIIGALGLVPLFTNYYEMTKNYTEKYYTEVISNGSYISFGIGYEFQILKKYFGYNAATKKTGTNEYFYH